MTGEQSRDSYRSAVEFLYGLRLFGAKFGLENTFKLAELCCNPQNKLRFIHVAGTNGKGSTCAMLESIYRAAGLRVGLFTSPHLVSFRERIQINRKLISEPEVVWLVNEIKPLLAKFPPAQHPTFFEVVTIVALRFFAEQKCDLVIWETGLGGRLDATNIVKPLASVVTNIDFDHQQWLGDTLEKIAAEKAGIIKPGISVVTAENKPAALAVIRQTARSQGAPLTVVLEEEARGTSPVALAGEHQRLNAALAAETVRILRNQIAVSEEQIRRGLSDVNWLGRFQLITRSSGQKIILDGAHNVAGAEALRVAIQQRFPATRPALILGILGDKDWERLCAILAPLASRIAAVSVASDRSASAAELANACQCANSNAEILCADSFASALQQFEREPFIVVAGSLYLVGEALELLGISEAKGERGLNEWTASPAAADKSR